MEKIKKIDFSFKVVNDTTNAMYSGGCSGDRSDCCTRVCTRNARPADARLWEKYLNDNKGVLMY